jgi:hypothetical protein
MVTGRKELLIGLAILGVLLAGEIFSALLTHYFSGPASKGLAFFGATFVAYVIFRRQARFGLLPSLGLCALAGLIAVLGELLWPGH